MTPVYAIDHRPAPVALSAADAAIVAAKKIHAYVPLQYTRADLLSMRASADRGEPVLLPGLPYTVRLHANPMFDDSYFAPDSLVRPYAGVVEGDAGSTVRLTVNLETDSLLGTVRLSTGELFFVEPVRDRGPVHVWYANEDAGLTASGPLNDVMYADGQAATPDHAAHATADEEDPAPEVQTGQYTYKVAYVRVYRDNATFDTAGTMNSVDGIYTKAGSVAIRLHVLGTTTISTNNYPDPTCGAGSTGAFLSDFQTAYGVSGTGHDRNDKAILFTDNPVNINYGNWLGCAYIGGTHGWARFNGSLKQKTWAGAHELGHTFGADHDDTVYYTHCTVYSGTTCVNQHNHYTIMHGTFEGDEPMDQDFSTTSKNVITSWAARYKAQIWSGSESSSHNVTLTWWEGRYPTAPVNGSQFRFTRTWASKVGTTVSLSRHFVAARSCGTESCNRDFGHNTPYTLTTVPVTHSWTYTLPVGATTWRFWPAYQLANGGAYGPFEWKKMTVAVG
jgi:hypothetical protein